MNHSYTLSFHYPRFIRQEIIPSQSIRILADIFPSCGFPLYGKYKEYSIPGSCTCQELRPRLFTKAIYLRRPSTAFSFRDLVIRFPSPSPFISQILSPRLASSLARRSFRDYESLLPAFRLRSPSVVGSKTFLPFLPSQHRLFITAR